MAADGSIDTQTMSFADKVPGSLDSRGSVIDHTRDQGFTTDHTLSEFFSRPIKIAEYEYDVSLPLFERFNPWTLFWENARNIEKIKNYNLLKSTLHVKFLINGNAFYYGRLIAAYEPLQPLDTLSPDRNWVPEDFIRGSQRMHVYLNPTQSQGGSLELPLFWNQNSLRIPQNDWRGLGTIVLASLNLLQHANGGTDPLTVTVMAWAENVSYSVPTRSVPDSEIRNSAEMGKKKKGDEHNTNVISRPASNVARVAGALTNVPVIGPFAKATQIGAGAVASVAKIFGYSAPTNLDYSIYAPIPRHSLAVVDTKIMANKLSVDSKQEITLDPATTGITSVDELPIASIAGRESYLTTFNWSTQNASDLHIWNARVDPGLHGRNGSEYHLPACAQIGRAHV